MIMEPNSIYSLSISLFVLEILRLYFTDSPVEMYGILTYNVIQLVMEPQLKSTGARNKKGNTAYVTLYNELLRNHVYD